LNHSQGKHLSILEIFGFIFYLFWEGKKKIIKKNVVVVGLHVSPVLIRIIAGTQVVTRRNRKKLLITSLL
jgi:hypothetical protein